MELLSHTLDKIYLFIFFLDDIIVTLNHKTEQYSKCNLFSEAFINWHWLNKLFLCVWLVRIGKYLINLEYEAFASNSIQAVQMKKARNANC